MLRRSLILMTVLSGALSAQTPMREGWRLMDGVWVQPQARVPISELVRLEQTHGEHRIVAQPSARIEPMLRNNRIAAIEIDASPLVWRLSAVGRRWDDTRLPSQHLQLRAALGGFRADEKLRLVRLEVSPDETVLEARLREADQIVFVYLVIGQTFVELATAADPTDAAARVEGAFVLRAPTALAMLREHPDESRRYLRPMLRLVTSDPHVLRPGAADVYRVFDRLPVDPLIADTVRRILPDLNDRDPRVRERASIELDSLGRRGVQAALRLDRARLAPEPADRVAAFIRHHATDARPREQLLADRGFLTDCLDDPDPHVRAEASRALDALNAPAK